jgi:hypothetical protein
VFAGNCHCHDSFEFILFKRDLAREELKAYIHTKSKAPQGTQWLGQKDLDHLDASAESSLPMKRASSVYGSDFWYTKPNII